MSILDELLRYEDDEPVSHRLPRRPSSFRWLVKPVLIAGIGSVVGVLLARLVGLAIPYPLVFMLLLAAQLLYRTIKWIAPAPVPSTLLRDVTPRRADPADLPADGLYLATTRWDTRLAWVRLQHDPEQFGRTVQPRLVQLVDERLRLRHGIIREREPERARRLVGDPLWTFLTRPVHQNVSPRELAELITMMEKI